MNTNFIYKATKFMLLSDLHLEFMKNIPEIIPKAPYLLLAGDIGYPEQPNFYHFLKNVSKKFETVFFVPGNHEYYQNYKIDIGLGEQIKTVNELDTLMKQICYSLPNVVYLNNDTYKLDDLIIIGSTLWSDVSGNDYLINDYNQVYMRETPKQLENVTLSYIKNLYGISKYYIQSEIKKCKETNTSALVLTHHLPSTQLIIPEYRTRYPKYISHFASNLEYLLDPEYVKAWCCGHSHAHVEEVINGVNCYMNCIGYPSEKYRGSSLDFTFSL